MSLRTVLMVGVVLASNNALALPAPINDPILWIEGKITQSNSDVGVQMDEAMLQSLDMGVIRTSNHVTDTVMEYSGPTFESLLDFLGAFGTHVKVMAWDDYVVTIPIEYLQKYKVLLATHENGERMTIDGKGPFFVVFPFSDFPELRSDYFYSLSVWQVREVIVE
tara:strand:+ start:524 stop:1018 length:495 start_codon:yes stop_codon:yes gene_type:complete